MSTDESDDRRPAPSPGAGKGAGQRPGGSAVLGVAIGVLLLSGIGLGLYGLMAPAPRLVAGPAFDTLRELERVVAEQTPGFVVRATAPETALRLGHDEFRFSVTSERDGFLYVLARGPDGALAQLVPNRLSGATVRLRKGQTWNFPADDGFSYAIREPVGPTQLLVLVSSRERRFDALQTEPAGEIPHFPGREELAAIVAARPSGGATLAGLPVCPQGVACSDEFGAVLLRLDTVR